ncbi:IcmT/TraK family protein [Fastidiosibacter lacustris]|uniref:IcmT/TraK family protein n=1 Tax=Fastidiosibacter lacustris TaxID=2056695 RepID=UPI000E34DF40|nr:IcmT/TraK family protein [Fastidiosibacter lacustris]
MNNSHTHWRDSGRKPKFFIIEAQVFIPIVLCLFHFRTWTLCLSIGTGILLFILSRYQVTLWVFLLNLREWLLGREKLTQKINQDE